MIAIIAGLWLSFLLGFCGALWLFPRQEKICPLCRERYQRDLDEWA